MRSYLLLLTRPNQPRESVHHGTACIRLWLVLYVGSQRGKRPKLLNLLRSACMVHTTVYAQGVRFSSNVINLPLPCNLVTCKYRSIWSIEAVHACKAGRCNAMLHMTVVPGSDRGTRRALSVHVTVPRPAPPHASSAYILGPAGYKDMTNDP